MVDLRAQYERMRGLSHTVDAVGFGELSRAFP